MGQCRIYTVTDCMQKLCKLEYNIQLICEVFYMFVNRIGG